MSRCSRTFIVLLTAVLSAFLPRVVEAQRVAGPFEGVLGGNKDAQQSLDFRGGLSAFWDDPLTRAGGPVEDDRFLQDGASLGGSAGLSHSRNTDGLQWTSSADSAFRLYGTDSDGISATLSGNTGIETKLNHRVSLNASLGVGFSPFFDYAPTMAVAAPVNAFSDPFRYATDAQRNMSFSESVGVSTRLSRRDTLTGGLGFQQYVFFDETSASTSSWSATGSYSRELTRNMGVHAGFSHYVGHYQYEDANGDEPSATTNSIDAGVHYGDSLQFSRRTALSFSTSTSVVHWENDTSVRVNGNVQVTRAIGRTGNAGVSYVRDTSFAAGFKGPLLSDTLSANFGAQLGRSVTWSAQTALSRGSIGFGDAAYGDYHSMTASVGVSRALTRRMGLSAGYSYYRYSVPSESTVITTLSKFSRQSVFGGLTVWVPLIGNERASR